MSFGYSVGDAVLLTGLAWKTVQNARKACGEYDELTREVKICHVVLRRLERELGVDDSPLLQEEDSEELRTIVDQFKRTLWRLDKVLEKYNALSEQERSSKRLWQRISFGNGKIESVRDQTTRLSHYTQALSLYLNMHTTGSVGRVERQMRESGGELKDIRIAVNDITAHLLAQDGNRHEGSILTTYSDDDKTVWKEFRRGLVKGGFRSSLIQEHKSIIQAYVQELGNRGFFDEEDPFIQREETERVISDSEPVLQDENRQNLILSPRSEDLSSQISDPKSSTDIESVNTQSEPDAQSAKVSEDLGQPLEPDHAGGDLDSHHDKNVSISGDELSASKDENGASAALANLHKNIADSKINEANQNSSVSDMQRSGIDTSTGPQSSDQARSVTPLGTMKPKQSYWRELLQLMGLELSSNAYYGVFNHLDYDGKFYRWERAGSHQKLWLIDQYSNANLNSSSSRDVSRGNANSKAERPLVPSPGVSLDERLEQIQISLRENGGEAIFMSTLDLYNTTYEPSCRKLMYTSSWEAERTSRIHENLRDDILTNVVLVFSELRWCYFAWDENLRKRHDQTVVGILRNLAILDSVLEDHPAHWLEILRKSFYQEIMGSLISVDPQRNRKLNCQGERTKNLTRRLCQDLVRLNDIPSQGAGIDLKLKKGELRYDIKATLDALLIIQDRSGWRWSNGEQLPSESQHYRPAITVNEMASVLVYRRWQDSQMPWFIRLRPLNLKDNAIIARSRRASCMSCMADNLSADSLVKLECTHRVCRFCVRMLFVLSLEDSEFMPPTCCTDAVIPFKEIEDICDEAFKKKWDGHIRLATLRNLATVRKREREKSRSNSSQHR